MKRRSNKKSKGVVGFSFTAVCNHGDNKMAFMSSILGVFWVGIVRLTGITINEACDEKRKVENVPVFS